MFVITVLRVFLRRKATRAGSDHDMETMAKTNNYTNCELTLMCNSDLVVEPVLQPRTEWKSTRSCNTAETGTLNGLFTRRPDRQ